MTKRRIPKIVEIVFASGLKGEFKVVNVDEPRGVANLELMSGTHKVETHIPFDAIRLAREDVNQAAARVVREATEKA